MDLIKTKLPNLNKEEASAFPFWNYTIFLDKIEVIIDKQFLCFN